MDYPLPQTGLIYFLWWKNSVLKYSRGHKFLQKVQKKQAKPLTQIQYFIILIIEYIVTTQLCYRMSYYRNKKWIPPACGGGNPFLVQSYTKFTVQLNSYNIWIIITAKTVVNNRIKSCQYTNSNAKNAKKNSLSWEKWTMILKQNAQNADQKTQKK